MKYEAPIVEFAKIEAEDIITASSTYKVEIEEKGDDSGNVIFDAIDLFFQKL